jgi:hypothetical protein
MRETLPSWRDGTAKRLITDFVARVPRRIAGVCSASGAHEQEATVRTERDFIKLRFLC